MKKKILVIDDEPEIVETLAELLREENYQVSTAISGEEGLKRLAKEKPDLILLDIRMPDWDGRKLLARIKGTEETSSIPVIMLTAVTDTKSILDSQDKRASDYIMKPFNSEQLLRQIRRYIG